jgi:DEAD/DEAH box helicase domain-containing protein
MSPQGHAKRRVSSLHEASRLLAQLVTLGLRTIAFVRTRAVAERLYEATCDLLEPTKRAVLGVYRAGYLKEKRREIEGDLFGGRLTAVVATTALELGVDVGSLDATLHLGYPGSTASMAQQVGPDDL